MKQFVLFTIFCLVTSIAFSQNKIGVRAGFLSTNTSVSEYERNLSYFYYDSVWLDTKVTRPTVNIDIDFDLGKRFFFSTGLSYSTKGISSINYTKVEYWYGAQQEYVGLNFLLKYHYKFSEQKFGVFAAVGGRADFAVGGPTSAEIATLDGASYFHAFGTYKVAEFAFNTIVGLSYKVGPGDIIIDVTFLDGLSDTLEDRYIVGRTFSIGATLGYSIYL